MQNSEVNVNTAEPEGKPKLLQGKGPSRFYLPDMSRNFSYTLVAESEDDLRVRNAIKSIIPWCR